jgi:multidrug efflux pump subunit AcrB
MKTLGLAGGVARSFISSKLTPLFVLVAVLLGVGAVALLPREEEPQIIVPMIDIFVQMPGADAREIEERVTKPMEKLLWEIPGVEYVYSTSSPGQSMAIVRFYVGESEDAAIVRLNQKMAGNFDLIPPGCGQPLVKPRSIDDVPVAALTLSSDRYDHLTLRRVAAQLTDPIKEIHGVSEVKVLGGRRRQVTVTLDEGRMAAYGLSPDRVLSMLRQANQQTAAGAFSAGNREFLVETGGFLRSAEDVQRVVVGVSGDRPVYVRDIAVVADGTEEPTDYVFFGLGAAAAHSRTLGPTPPAPRDGVSPAVTITVAKRKGLNAIVVADQVIEKVTELQGKLVPADMRLTVTRNYGETAAEKSNELLFHMLLAIISVTLLVALTLGWRESGIVAVAIPVTLALTLVVFHLYGYTINRVTLFALIFSIGILVDDAIVVVENIVRHYRMPLNERRPLAEVAVEAVDEVGNPTILATFAVVAAILPLAFVRGLMGPYMRPIPVGASAAMIFSLIVAFVVTPWAAMFLLRRKSAHTGSGGGDAEHEAEGWTTRLYRRVMGRLIHSARWRVAFLAFVAALLVGACSFVFFKLTLVKMLPFDNKSEFQVVIDMPEGTTLEQTASVTQEMADYLRSVPEVTDVQLYVGSSAPYNFNGLVRHYFLRSGPNVADIQVNLAPRDARKSQSHPIAKRVRPELNKIAKRAGARIKVAEVPPGPPVLQTLVVEVYGPDYRRQIELARQVRDVLDTTDGVVDVDWYVEDDQPKLRFVIDHEKAALHGISAEQVSAVLRTAIEGSGAGLLHVPREKEDVPIVLRLRRSERSSGPDLQRIKVRGAQGQFVALGEIVRVEEVLADKSIYHKNLLPVVYVTGDVAGNEESPVYAIFKMKERLDKFRVPEGYLVRQYTAEQPFSTEKFSFKWDGEWYITYEVFRDMGLAFAVVLVLIYVLVVGWFQSMVTPLVIMAAIPFSLVGILPAHWAMGSFFTATSMIGFIAGAGIVVRNSIILVDFIELRIAQGMPLAEAVIDAGAVRFRPMMLTAAAVIVGASVILFDPIFQGLAISLMAGEIASLFLSRMTVPVLYYLSRRGSVK